MAELKTKPNDADVEAFLNSVADEKKRQDCFTVLDIIDIRHYIDLIRERFWTHHIEQNFQN